MDFSSVQHLSSPKATSAVSEKQRYPKLSLKTVTFEQVLSVVNDLVFAKRNKNLSEAEVVVLKGAWNNDDYEEMASNSPYSLNYLQRRIAPPLWSLLSEIFTSGERVGKKKLRHILLEQVTEKYHIESEAIEKRVSYTSTKKPAIVLGDQPPDVPSFNGRTQEFLLLRELIIKQRCVVLTGVAGIGKSALAAKLIEKFSLEPLNTFDCFVWKSVSHAPSVHELIVELIKLTGSIEFESNEHTSIQTNITFLIKQLQSRRCLVIIDESEVLFHINNSQQQLDYKLFFRRLIEEKHQSCFLLTSRVWTYDFDALMESNRPIQNLKLEGLDHNAAMDFLNSLGLEGEEKHLSQLIQTYRGNPSELKAIANRVHHFFAGDISIFLNNQTTLFSSRFQEMLNNFFAHTLNEVQKRIMIYLAEKIAANSQFTNFNDLLEGLKQKYNVPLSTSELIFALEALEKDSLIESIKDPFTKEISFTLQPAVKKYILKDPQGLVYSSQPMAIAS